MNRELWTDVVAESLWKRLGAVSKNDLILALWSMAQTNAIARTPFKRRVQAVAAVRRHLDIAGLGWVGKEEEIANGKHRS